MSDVVAIFGPTAVGKTGVAIELGALLRERGEDPVAVNCDAIQLYRGLEILSGTATAEEQSRLEHRLLSFVEPSEEFSAGRYAELAQAEIDALLAEGRMPIVVGGTGLYLRAALADLDLRPPVPAKIRTEVEAEIASRGAEALHDELEPALAAGVEPADRKRIARLTELQRAGIEPHQGAEGLWTANLRHPTLLVGLTIDRDELASRIDARVAAMIAAGAAEEARAVAETGASRTARAALGFEQLLEGHDGPPPPEAIEAIKAAHRRYARRQLTWMRRMEGVTLVDRTGRADEEIAREVVARLDRVKGDTPVMMPSAEPIEVVRALNSYWAVRPFELVRALLLASRDWDDAVRRFAEAGLRPDPIDPDVEVVVDVDLVPEGAAWIGQRGRDQWISFWKWWFEAWDDLQIDDSDYEQMGNHVLVEMQVRALPRGSTEPIEMPVVQLFKIREGLICLYGVYPNRDEALAAIRVE